MTAVTPGRTGNQFNLVAQARRQPGSTFKTFVLDGRDQRGHEPRLDLLHLGAVPLPARPVHAGLGRPDLRPLVLGLDLGSQRDARLRQHGLRAADARRRPGQGRRDGAQARHPLAPRRRARDGSRRRRDLAARGGLGLRDARRGRDLLEADGDPQGRARQRQGGHRRRLGQAAAAARDQRRRRLRGDEDPRGQRARRHRRRRLLRPPRRRQDRHDRQPRGRLVLRVRAAARDDGLGRLPAGRDPDAENVHGIAVAGGTFPATIWKLFMETAMDEHARAQLGLPARPGRLGALHAGAVRLEPPADHHLLLARRRPAATTTTRSTTTTTATTTTGRTIITTTPPAPPPPPEPPPPPPPVPPPPPPPVPPPPPPPHPVGSRETGAARRARRDPGLPRRLRRARRRALPRGAVPRRPRLPGVRGAAPARVAALPRRLRRVPARRVRGLPAADRPRRRPLQRALQDADGPLRRRRRSCSSRSCWPSSARRSTRIRVGVGAARALADRARADLAQHLRRLAGAS